MKNRKGYFALLGLIVSLVVALVVCYLVFKSYLVPLHTDKADDNKLFKSEGIDTSSYQSIKDSTKKKMDEINKQYEKQLNSISVETGQ